MNLESLIDMNTDEVIEARLCAWNSISRDGRLVLETCHSVDPCSLLIITESKPLLPHDGIINATARRRVVVGKVVASQLRQALLRKAIRSISGRRHPGVSGGGEQQSCCDGGCEVHEIGGG